MNTGPRLLGTTTALAVSLAALAVWSGVPATASLQPGTALPVAVAGRYAYVADGRAGLQIADISEPSSRRIVGIWRRPTGLIGIGCDDLVLLPTGTVAVRDRNQGLRLIDVTDPERPRQVWLTGGSTVVPVRELGRAALLGDALIIGLAANDFATGTRATVVLRP